MRPHTRCTSVCRCQHVKVRFQQASGDSVDADASLAVWEEVRVASNRSAPQHLHFHIRWCWCAPSSECVAAAALHCLALAPAVAQQLALHPSMTLYPTPY